MKMSEVYLFEINNCDISDNWNLLCKVNGGSDFLRVIKLLVKSPRPAPS